jgi:hypothetical protein
MNRGGLFTLLGFIIWCGGCASLQGVPAVAQADPAKPADEKPKEEPKPPKTLLEWNLCKKDEKKDEDKNGKDKEKGKNDGEKGGDKNGKDKGEDKDKADEDGGGDKGGDKDKEEEEPKRIDPDRPHLPEASTTVGPGRAVLEAGYTYNTSGGFFPLHSYPEALLRIGVLADWLEVRIAQNIVSEPTVDQFGVRTTTTGPDDLQLGIKLALTEQQKCLPESALILQMTVPTGERGLTADRVLPGVHYDCSWEIIKDLLSVETVLIADGSVDDHGHTFTTLGHGVTAVYDVTKKLEAFGELDSFYASGDSAPPQHYFVAGLVYFFTPNCEIDFRAGVGLNDHADGYLVGSGFAFRY